MHFVGNGFIIPQSTVMFTSQLNLILLNIQARLLHIFKSERKYIGIVVQNKILYAIDSDKNFINQIKLYLL